jgi:uncharacterized membrane protein HdeD (DUF308 family)
MKARIAGILLIITGVLGIVWGILLLVNLQFAYLWGFNLALAIVELVFGIIAIVGGVFAILHKNWNMTMTGAILGIFTFFPTAIAAIVLLILDKKMFRAAAAAPA